MVLMRMFCFWCSVRLATVFAAVIGGISSILFGTLVLVNGPERFRLHFHWIQRFNEDHVRNALLQWLLSQSDGCLTTLYWLVIWSNGIHVASSALALVGCLKLLRPLVGQFIVVHAFKLVFYNAYLVTNLVLLKKQINLGMLILVILLEGLAMVFFWYNLAAVIALFQIIKVVKSRPYQIRFGICTTRGYTGILWTRAPLSSTGSKVVVDPNAEGGRLH